MTNKSKDVEYIRIGLKSEIADDLKRFAINKYGRTYGTLSIICQEAIVQYLDSQGATHTHTHASQPTEPQTMSKPKKSKNIENNDIFSDDKNNGKISNKNTSTTLSNLRNLSTIIAEQGGCEASKLYPEYIVKLIKKNIGFDERTVRHYYTELKQYFMLNDDQETFGIDLVGMQEDGLL